MQYVRKRQREGKKAETERKKRSTPVFVASGESHSICTHLSQYCGKPMHWRKYRLGGCGLLLERKYRLEREREGGRQAEKQRERAGVGNPPLHLLVIYSFMFSCRLARWLVFWRWRSSAPRPTAIPRKTRSGHTEESRKRQHKEKVEPHFDWQIFHPFPFLTCQDALLLPFFLKVRDRKKKNTDPVDPSFSLCTELNLSSLNCWFFLLWPNGIIFSIWV